MMAHIEKPDFQKEYADMLNTIPMRRLGEMDDIKGAAVFLASKASAYMTGHILAADGGFLAQ
jgi:NAD(P)-dependent dehydrogenase (short-subunit alcohol dehydrogenase family)